MSEMIERVARAMWAHEWGEHVEQQPFEASCREHWLDAARAAIEAIRLLAAERYEGGDVAAGYVGDFIDDALK